MNLDDLLSQSIDKPSVAVRLSTSYWKDRKGIHMCKSLTWMRRMSSGNNYVEDDASMGGVDAVFKMLTNLDECKDGIYRIDTVNVSRDFESGHVDSWDYKLIPIAAATPATVQGVKG